MGGRYSDYSADPKVVQFANFRLSQVNTRTRLKAPIDSSILSSKWFFKIYLLTSAQAQINKNGEVRKQKEKARNANGAC